MATAMEVGTLLVGGLGTLMGTGGIWALLSTRAKLKASPPADLLSAAATFQSAINAGANDLVAGLERRIDGLGHDLAEARDRIATLEQDNETCRQEGRALQQSYDSLKRQLIAQGINLPAERLSGSFVVIEDGRTTMMKQEPPSSAAPPKRKPRRRRPTKAAPLPQPK